jgi:glyoxylase-like metal-dependent hydrolase (beta-lactamase superfamily II)
VSPDVYVGVARRRGWRIRSVLETHIHADHLSRARQLAASAGAVLLLPDPRRVRFPFAPVSDGQRIQVGKAGITARLTPGHTDESISYVLNDEAVFTGDTLFTNAVGRPDLHASADGGRTRAASLFGSLVQLSALAPDVLVLPAHAGGPIAFDGRAVSAGMGEVGTWLSEWLVSEASFVERVMAALPVAPPNFARIVELNEAGELPASVPTDLEAGANRCAVSG